MRVHVVLKQKEAGSNRVEILKDGIGLLKGNTLVYFEDQNDKCKHEITFDDHSCVLKRIGDVKSEIHLHKDREEKSFVHSPYGVMEIISYTHAISKNSSLWEVEYSLYQNKTEVLRQTLTFEIEPLA